MREIIGNTTATPNPRPDWAQTDRTKADYIKNKPTNLSDFANDMGYMTEQDGFYDCSSGRQYGSYESETYLKIIVPNQSTIFDLTVKCDQDGGGEAVGVYDYATWRLHLRGNFCDDCYTIIQNAVGQNLTLHYTNSAMVDDYGWPVEKYIYVGFTGCCIEAYIKGILETISATFEYVTTLPANAKELTYSSGGVAMSDDNLFIRYSTSADGSNFTESWSDGQNYMGIAIGEEAPTDKADYEWVLFKGPVGDKGEAGKSAYECAKEGGYAGTESEFAEKLAEEFYVPEEIYVGDGVMPEDATIQIIMDGVDEEQALKDELKDYIDEELAKFPGGGTGCANNSVTAYDAKGDGKADDIEAFQRALLENRTVYVPGGTYRLTSGLVIGDNCVLELAQDAVLNFTQTTGNCITLGMSSTLRGNHATIKVPYAFSGIVIYAYSNDTTDAEQTAVPPWSKWCPQWKSGRYVTDINICKANASGNHESVGGECSGTAVYLSANGNGGSLTYMWGIHYSGLRIAGAFSYGIRAVNLNKGWMNDMRVDAFIDACEIGVQLEDCHNAYISAIIQPRTTWHEDESKRIKYAKHGIKLIRSTNADLSGSRVWDWDDKRSLWAEGGEYQHIAMYGDCSGAIINDFRYHGSGDTRNRIYTNYASNLETVTILQEPIDRWFKSTDNKPYFYDGASDVLLATEEYIDAHFVTDEVPNFTDVLATSTDANGEIYNGKGYKDGAYLNSSGNEVASTYYKATGFIPIKANDVMYFRDLNFDSAISAGDGNAILVYYKADKTKAFTQTCTAMNEATRFYYQKYERTADGMKITFYDGVQEFGNDVSVRLSFRNYDFGENAVISINEEIKYNVEGFLAPNVKVHAENVVGLIGGGSTNALPYYLTQIYNEDDPTTCDKTVAEIEAVYASGRDIKFRAYVDTETMYIMSLFYIGSSDNGHVFGFENSLAKRFLNPQADGTYVITTSLS